MISPKAKRGPGRTRGSWLVWPCAALLVVRPAAAQDDTTARPLEQAARIRVAVEQAFAAAPGVSLPIAADAAAAVSACGFEAAAADAPGFDAVLTVRVRGDAIPALGPLIAGEEQETVYPGARVGISLALSVGGEPVGREQVIAGRVPPPERVPKGRYLSPGDAPFAEAYRRAALAAAIVRLLASHAPGRTLAPLLGAATGGDPALRGAAAAALWGNLGAPRAALVECGVKALPALREALNSPDRHARLAAASALGHVPSAEPLVPLSDALTDGWWAIRAAAAQSLGLLGHGAAVPHLTRALEDSSAAVRQAAAEGLGLLNDARAVEPLADLLADESFAVRASAARSLGALGAVGAARPLVAALGDDVGSVAAVAEAALEALADADRDAVTEALLSAPAAAQPRAAELLARLAYEPRSLDERLVLLVRRRAWEELARLRQDAIPVLIPALADSRSDVRAGAAETLIGMREAALEPAVQALGDARPGVRAGAARVLADLAAQTGPEDLQRMRELGDELAALQDELAELSPLASLERKREELLAERARLREQPRSKSRDRRLRDIETHLDVLSKQAKEMADLQMGLEEPPRLAEVRAEIERVRREQEQLRQGLSDQTALAARRDEKALGPLLQLLADADADARAAGARAVAAVAESLGTRGALGEDGPAARMRGPLVTALGAPEAGVRFWAARALGHIGGPGAAEALAAGLSDEDGSVRWQAARALGYLRAGGAVPALLEALAHTSADTREAAAEALGSIGDPRAAAPLASVLSDADEAASVRLAAARALGDLSDRDTIPSLAQALHDGDAQVRAAAATALGEMAAPAAVQPLQELLEREQQAAVIDAARQALIQLRARGLPLTTAP